MLQLINKKTGQKGKVITKDQWDDLKQNPIYRDAFKVLEIETSKASKTTEASKEGGAKKATKSPPKKAKKD